MTQELYKKHRPAALKHLVGQPDAVKVLTDLIKSEEVPHAILFTGPSGCGKTTLARILKRELDCGDGDFSEVNCADFRGIDMIRDIRSRMSLSPISGSCRIWLIDECHKLTNDAQTAFLKMLEDTPGHVYFMLATTDPGKLLKTIQTRCTEVRVKALPAKALTGLVKDIAGKEKAKITDEVAERIAEVADGSARKALVLLQSVKGLEDEEAMLSAILSSDSKRQAIEIARALLNPRTKWQDVAVLLKEVEEEPETIRHLVLSYATSVMLGGGKMVGRAFQMIQSFRDHFYDSKKAGLVAACYEVLTAEAF